MLRTALATGLLLAITGPALAQDQVRLIYPTQQTTVIERTTITTVQQDDPGAPPLQAQEIDGAGPPPRHHPGHRVYRDDPSSMPPEEDSPQDLTGQAQLQDEQGNDLQVRSWQGPSQDWGAPPSFESLDRNGDGRISETEAQAYPLLANDFLYAAGKSTGITRARYQWWVQQAR